MFTISQQMEFESENKRLLNYGFNTSEILDLRLFGNISERLKDVKTVSGILTIGGISIQKFRDYINRWQFVEKAGDTYHVPNYVVRNFKLTQQDVDGIERYIRARDLNKFMGTLDGKKWFSSEWAIFGFRLDEIRDALTEYRQREAYFKAQNEPKIKLYNDII